MDDENPSDEFHNIPFFRVATRNSDENSAAQFHNVPFSWLTGAMIRRQAMLSRRTRSPAGLQLPATAVGRVNELVGFGTIPGLRSLRVPFDLFAHAQGDVAQQDSLGEHGGVVEIRHRRPA